MFRQNKWFIKNYSQNAQKAYESFEGKLALLKAIISSNWIKPDEVLKWQCLVIAFGDALAQKLNLHWVQVSDEYGVDAALQYANSSILLFPQTMISKRIERGEKVDVYLLFDELVKQVTKMIDSSEYS